jgi:apolipoprotein N-acyltransferase
MEFTKPLPINLDMPSQSKRRQARYPFLLSGLLTAVAYPPLPLFPFAWVSFLPLLFAARGLPFWLAFRRGWWAGLVFNALLLYWIALNSGADFWTDSVSYLGLVLILSLYWALFTSFWAVIYRRWGILGALLLPAIWVGLEVIKNSPEISFPWLELGLSQISFLPITQIAEIGGIRFVSAWVILINVAIFLSLQKKHKVAMVAGALACLGIVWGFWRMNHLTAPGPTLRVVAIQGNIDPEEKWHQDPDSSLAIYVSLTQQALRSDSAAIVVWPETAVPVYLGYQTKYQNKLQSLALNTRSNLLTGALHYEYNPKRKGGHDLYNSAFFISKNRTSLQRYDKMQLVPFGERVPFQRWFPSLGELNFGQAEFTAGTQYPVFELGNGIKASAQICFESVFGDQTRQFVLRGANVLCNLTNDGWYGRSNGPFQHAALVRFSCIETRCPLVRSANTGVSLVIDRAGKVIKSLPLGKRGFIQADISSGGYQQTFYVRYGEIIPQVLLILAIFSVTLAMFGHRKHD